MDLNGAHILVIGGAGFIGSHVVEQLLAEPVAQVTVYDNFSRGKMENLAESLKDDRFRIFPLGGDILHPDLLEEAVADADAVVHLAALWLLHCHEYPASAFEVNIQGTFHVLQACVKHKIKRLVFSSSASVYGDALQVPMEEDHPYNNWTFYGATKISGEHMFKAYHRRYGLDGSCLRYMNVYGPRQDYRGAYIAVMMRMLDCIDRGESPKVFGDGSQSYDFIEVSDVARANVCALKSDVPFGFYNIGRGIRTSILELAELLLDLTGSPLSVEFEPAGETFVRHRVGSIDAARQALGFSWSVELREGMKRLVEWRTAQTRTPRP